MLKVFASLCVRDSGQWREIGLTAFTGLDDLCVRFIINLPQDDLSSVPRICFQVEEAQWYYEDFIRPLDPSLPSMNLRTFCLRIFAHCPLLSAFSQENHISAFEDWLQYKTRVPVRGAILLNEAMDSVILVKGWKKGATWSFPRGKINKDEDDLDCAIREVYEETGYDLTSEGLVPVDRQVKHIEINMREQNIRLYVFKDVPMDTYFEPRTRKEISRIQWWHLSDLPAFRKKGQQAAPQSEPVTAGQKFYVVAPFLVPLKKWVVEQKKANKRVSSNHYLSAGMSHDEPLTEEDQVSRSYQTGHPSGHAPDKSVLEDATATLKGLLKIQPPTEGLQLDTSHTVETPAPGNDDKGAALLALLKPPISKMSHTPEKPHTPVDQVYDQAPMPNSPHHGHPQHSYPNLPPPPLFLSQNQHSIHPYHQASETARSLNHATMQQPRANVQQTYRPQQSIHPQPLPPYVQRAMFGGAPPHCPAALSSHQASGQHMQAPQILPFQSPQFPTTQAPSAGFPAKQPQVQLTSHKLALLNAFQSCDQATGSAPGANDLPLRRYAQEVSASPPAEQPQELPAESTETEGNPFPSPFGLPHSIAPAVSPNGAPSKTRITTEHQSTLLSIFKNPNAAIPSPSLPPSATALPLSNTPSAVELSAAAPLNAPSARAAITPKTILTRGASKKGPITQDIQELTSETKISKSQSTGLARLLQTQTSRSTERSMKANGGSAMLNNGNNSKNEQSEKPFQPQILKRPQSMTSQKNGGSVSVCCLQASFDRRPSAPTEHVQTLLSLFGKSPTVSDSGTTTHLKEAPAPIPSTEKLERSRTGSLASLLNETASRRSSPISPADKGFLLGYLDAVAKSGSR